MKFSSIFQLTATTAVLLSSSQADPTHQISSSYNTLFFYDTGATSTGAAVEDNTNFITNTNFVNDIINSTTLAWGNALHDVGDDNLNWDYLLEKSETVLSNTGWILEGTSKTAEMTCSMKEDSTVQEILASVYKTLGGPDSQELGELLQANNQAVLDPEAAEVLKSWLDHSSCLEGPGKACVGRDNGQSVSIMYLQEGSTPQDLSILQYIIYFTSGINNQAMLTKQVVEHQMIGHTISQKWTFNQDLYDSVRDTVAEKVANSTTASAQLAGPAYVLDRDEVIVQPFQPVELMNACGLMGSASDETPPTMNEPRPSPSGEEGKNNAGDETAADNNTEPDEDSTGLRGTTSAAVASSRILTAAVVMVFGLLAAM